MPTGDQSIKTLVRELFEDVGLLIRQELRLAQAETTQKLSRARHGAMSLAIGILLGFCSLLILLQALVVALSEFMEPWLASVVVPLGTGIVALILVKSGQSRLDPQNLTPERTMRSMQKDSELVTGRAP